MRWRIHTWRYGTGSIEIRDDLVWISYQISRPVLFNCKQQSFVTLVLVSGYINGMIAPELPPFKLPRALDRTSSHFALNLGFQGQMALVPICYRVPYKDKDHVDPIHYVIRGPSKGLESRLRCSLAHNSQEQNRGTVQYASGARTNEKQLSSLDSYFGKLQRSSSLPPENASKTSEAVFGRENDRLELKEELDYLDAYLGKLNKDTNQSEKPVDVATGDNIVPGSVSIIQESANDAETKLIKSYISTTEDNAQDSEISDLYLIGILGSINIAVFLFEIASPVRNSDLDLFSLPSIYGAKINDLILVGEWWRLVTPMFLHTGLVHIAIGSWGLVTFGPKVCRGYGSFTFFLIYMLGGISGNLISFFHTPEPTVGGTGPIFAMIGAWLIYESQNKDIVAKEVSESMFQKAIIATALTFTLSSFGPIDDWTHFGAALTGIAYGFLTCPSLQLDDASSSSTSGQEEGITLVRRYADPCKSLFLFTVFVLVLSSLLLFVEPPLNSLE